MTMTAVTKGTNEFFPGKARVNPVTAIAVSYDASRLELRQFVQQKRRSNRNSCPKPVFAAQAQCPHCAPGLEFRRAGTASPLARDRLRQSGPRFFLYLRPLPG